MLEFLVGVGTVAGAVAALGAAMSTRPARWLLRQLFAAPSERFIRETVGAELDAKINGGIDHLHVRLDRLETAAGMDPLRVERRVAVGVWPKDRERRH